MKKPRLSAELVMSAAMAAIAAALLYSAAYGNERTDLAAVLAKLGCAISFASLAIQPGALFGRVRRDGRQVTLPRLRGVASALNVASAIVLFLALVSWAFG